MPHEAANLIVISVQPAGCRFCGKFQAPEEERGGVAELRRTSDDEGNAEIAQKRHSYFKPSTSCMSYSPGVLPTTHLAARTLPRENMSRVMARWEISIRSPMPMK